MKKAVAFLLAFLIFVAPMTTFVKADVVIGDNDDIIVNENAKILGRKMAIMESFSDLMLSGVTEFTISNTNSVDDYIDSLWTELNDAIDSLSNGEGFTEISNTLKSKYIYNLMNYRDYITNRGNYLSYTLQNPTTSLLQTFFADNIYGKIETTHYDLALDMFRALSNFNRGTIYPDTDPDPNYQTYLDFINGSGFWFKNYPNTSGTYNGNTVYTLKRYPPTLISWVADDSWNTFTNYAKDMYYLYGSDILDLYISKVGSQYSFSFSYTSPNMANGLFNVTNTGSSFGASCNFCNILSNQFKCNSNNAADTYSKYFSSSGSLNTIFNYIKDRFKNVNIYVDGVCWSYVGGGINPPTLDIDGILKIYGNDNPQQYQLQPNTKIDYDELYQVIYNAIRDNLPISQDDVTYYDSHDNIYSPTIINNYGDEEGEESDLIDTILDYAVIPKFDTAIAQPMRQALTNGVVIMNTSITDVIPNEILLILGACFFLVLFAVVINRMIK